MKIRVGVFDRIQQSFNLFKENFLSFFSPIFIYNILSAIVFGSVLVYSFFMNLDELKNLENLKDSSEFLQILYSPEFLIIILLLVILLVIYLILYIPFVIGLIKSIKQAEKGEEVDALKNVKYGFSRLLDSFKTYWYMFAYVALIPALIFIVGGILFNIGFYSLDNNGIQKIGALLMGLGGVIFLIFAVYRGIKTTFSINSAIDKDSFTKENFLYSLEITKNNWWRILGNFLLVGLLVSTIIGTISLVLNIIFSITLIPDNIDSINSLESILSNFSISTYSIYYLFDTFFKTISTVFVLIFSYIFYLRLFRESNYNEEIESKKDKNEEKIEL